MKMMTVEINTDNTSTIPKTLMKNCVTQKSIIPIRNGMEYKIKFANWSVRTKYVTISKMKQIIDNGNTIEGGNNVPRNTPITANTHIQARCCKMRRQFGVRAKCA